jgi:hypothetical protein
MGIFSLDLSKTLRLDIYNDSYADEIIEKLNAFINA